MAHVVVVEVILLVVFLVVIVDAAVTATGTTDSITTMSTTSTATSTASSGRHRGRDAAKVAKLMVVFAEPGNATGKATPRTMYLFDELDRRSDVPEEPSVELLPPHEDGDDLTSSMGYGHLGPQEDVTVGPSAGYSYPKPQQNDPKPATGYNYPRPQRDDLKPTTGYNYPRPQLDDLKPTTGYNYPRPQQDGSKPATGYNYPKPQQDDLKPAAGYNYPKPQQYDPKTVTGYNYPKPQQDDPKPVTEYDYPKPQQDDPKPVTEYNYPKPQQDDPKPATGYNYPKPQQDDRKPANGYNYPTPEEDEQVQLHQRPQDGPSTWRPMYASTPDQDYLPPKQDLPLEDQTRPSYGQPLPDTSTSTVSPFEYPPRQPPVMQDELPYSYLPPSDAHSPPIKPPVNDVPPNSYVPPKQPPVNDVPPNSYVPPKQPPVNDVPLNSYVPPKQPPVNDVPLNSYVPPKQPPVNDVPLNSYLPPKQTPMNDVPLNSYVPPKQPPVNDVPLNSYVPPTDDNAVPSITYLPPQDEPPLRPLAEQYGDQVYIPLRRPSVAEDDAKATAQPRHLSSVLRAGSADEHGIRVTDMSCLRTASRARFTATITSPSFVAWPPVLEGVAGAPPPGCRVIADPADPHHRFLVDLSHPDLTRCGVRGCSADGEARLCSRMLMPSVPGLRLASDPVLLLQCALQPATGSLLQQAKVVATQPATGRAAGVVHAGGERAQLRAHLQLFRRGSGGEFSRQMQSGGAVHLGDDLQLRAVVRRGDGWQASRMSDVVVRRASSSSSSSGGGGDAVHLVAADGCPNPEMRAVCPRPQAWLAGDPLVSLLALRVFMFRGMQDGDQLVVTARVVACLDRHDCTVDGCVRSARTRRSGHALGHADDATTMIEDSVSFSVRVVGMNGRSLVFDSTSHGLADGAKAQLPHPEAVLGLIALVVFLASVPVGLSVLYRARRTQLAGDGVPRPVGPTVIDQGAPPSNLEPPPARMRDSSERRLKEEVE